MNEEIKPENMRIHSRADELISCLEGEIAKRDERIVELELEVALRDQALDRHVEYGKELRAELAAIKAQGVVMPELRDFEEWWCSTPILRESKRTIAEKAWLAARLNAAPVQQVSVPDGRKLVPVEPTKAMLFACEDAGSIHNQQRGKRIYEAMLAAAPAAPAADAGLVEALKQAFPLFDEDGLNELYHHCEIAVLGDRKRLHKLLAAPSPAGEDGLDTDRNAAFKACPESGCDWGSFYLGWKARGEVEQAIIDGLRGENETLRKRAKTAEREAGSALKTYKGLEKVARVVSDNSDQVCGELNVMRQERDQQAQRIGELEGLLTAERNKVPLYEAVERACGDLPEGWKVELHMENGAGWIELYDPEGIEVENFPTNNERLDYTINDATDAALSAGKDSDQ